MAAVTTGFFPVPDPLGWGPSRFSSSSPEAVTEECLYLINSLKEIRFSKEPHLIGVFVFNQQFEGNNIFKAPTFDRSVCI